MFIVPTVSQLSCRHHKRPEGLDREERQLWQNRRPHRSALHQRQAATADTGRPWDRKAKSGPAFRRYPQSGPCRIPEAQTGSRRNPCWEILGFIPQEGFIAQRLAALCLRLQLISSRTGSDHSEQMINENKDGSPRRARIRRTAGRTMN